VSSVVRPHRAAGWNVAVPAMIRDSAIPHARRYPARIRGQSTFFGQFGVGAPFDLTQNAAFLEAAAVPAKPFHADADISTFKNQLFGNVL
jgi:hypothetical protein